MSATRTLMLAACLGLAAAVQAQAPADTTKHPLKPGWWRIPGTQSRMTIGGYVKADLIHDLKPIGSPNFFDVSKIPTDGSTGQSTRLQAMETRLFLDVRRDSRFGEMKAYVEGDFYGSGNTFRLRHAYVAIGERWLIGQSWSTFMDEGIIPATLDFEKPAAYAFVRHAQVRYTQPLGEKLAMSLALEDPSANILTPGPGKVSTPVPDLVGRVKWKGTRCHVQLSGFLGGALFVPESGSDQRVIASGVNLSGALKVGKRDQLTGQVIYGPGIARYRFGHYAAPDVNGDIKPITGIGATVGYQHYWAPAWSSFAVYNYGIDQPEDGEPSTDADMVSYGAVNLLWHFVDHAFVGVEYLYGLREDLLGNQGTADRIMLSVRMDIN
jgi:hypothetical protein